MNKYVYRLEYIPEIRKSDEEEINVKLLGIFSSKEEVYGAIEIYKNLPGFKERQRVFEGYEYGEGFFISTATVGRSGWEGGFSAEGYTTLQKEEITLHLPFWFEATKMQFRESSTHFAERMMNNRYHTKNYPKNPQSEFYQIKKFKELNKD